MATARIGSKTQSRLSMLIYGEQFTGKSTMAMQFAYFKRTDGKPFRILYIDPESGSIDDYLPELEENGVDLRNIYIVYTQSLGEVREYISKAKNNEDFYELDEEGNETENVVLDADGEPFRVDAIVVDGTTVLNLTTKQGLIEFSKKRNAVKAKAKGLVGDERLVKIEGAGLEYKDYNTVNFKGQDLILDLMGCGKHFVVTARETDEKETIKLEDGTTTSVSTGRRIPDGFKALAYNVKTEIRMFRNEDGVVCAHIKKDRTHVHEDNITIEDPSLIDWQVVIDKTANNTAFVVKNDLSKSVAIEQNIYKKEALKIIGDDENSTENETENASSIDDVKAKIKSLQASLNPVQKSEAKKKLTEASLPTAFKAVTDIDVLNKVVEVLSTF